MSNEEDRKELETLESPETQETEETLTEEDEDKPNGLIQKIPKKYLQIGAVVGVTLIALLLIVIITPSEEAPEVVEIPEENIEEHPLVAISQLMSIPTQTYEPNKILIANTPSELMEDLIEFSKEDWKVINTAPARNGLTKTFQKNDTNIMVSPSIKVYPDDQIGRKEMFDTFEMYTKDNDVIVSENSKIGSGGFITNDSQTLMYWFYFEPNIVATITMEQHKGGTINDLKEWAHRLNKSIYRIVD